MKTVRFDKMSGVGKGFAQRETVKNPERMALRKMVTVMLLLTVAQVAFGQDQEQNQNPNQNLNHNLNQNQNLMINAEADLVSSYVWRGIYQTGVSIQPSLTASFSGFTLGVWGSTDFSTWFKEFDFSLFYETGGLSFGITDYWWSGQWEPYFNRKGKNGAPDVKYKENHLLEISIGYHFGDGFPLSLGWNTMFFGDQDKNLEDKQMFSSYLSVGYDFPVKDVKCNVEMGFNTWESMYSNKFDLMRLSFKALKTVTVTDKFSMPAFAQMILCPATNDAHLIFGLKF